MAHARGRFQKKIDTVHWTYGSFTFLAQAAGSAAVNVLSAQHLPETLLRIRGEFISYFANVLVPDIAVAMTVGLILVPEGTGTTVLWDPIGDGDAPWIWWDTMHLGYSEAVVDVIANQSAMSGRRVIDSKAMRKIRNTELQCVVTNASVEGTASCSLIGSVRVLAGS